jgi:hypothetical protein
MIDRNTIEENIALMRCAQARHGKHQRTLAGGIRSDKPYDLSSLYREIDVVQNLHVAVKGV